MGCTGAKFWEEEAPLYAERRATAPASAMNPGTSAHFRLLVIEEDRGWNTIESQSGLVKIFTRPRQVRKYDDPWETAQAPM